MAVEKLGRACFPRCGCAMTHVIAEARAAGNTPCFWALTPYLILTSKVRYRTYLANATVEIGRTLTLSYSGNVSSAARSLHLAIELQL